MPLTDLTSIQRSAVHSYFLFDRKTLLSTVVLLVFWNFLLNSVY